MQLRSSGKKVRLDQLTEEMRALPGLSRLQGLSASIDQVAGEVEIKVHVEAPALTAEEERAIEEAVARHVPDPQWGVSEEEKELAAVLSREDGSLGLADVEKALRALARMLDLRCPETAAELTINGSGRE